MLDTIAEKINWYDVIAGSIREKIKRIPETAAFDF